MKIFYFAEENALEQLFMKPQPEIPFLNSTLFEFSKDAFTRLGEQINDDVQIIADPAWGSDHEPLTTPNILEYLSEEPELVFFTNVFSIFFAGLDKEYIQHLKQNPGKLFMAEGTVCGYLSKDHTLSEPEVDKTLQSFFFVNETNFLRVTNKLVGQLQPSLPEVESNEIYGFPTVLSESVKNSTICGPCFIGPDVVVSDSYIAPGTVITGESVITNSSVFSSVLSDSRLETSTITSTLTSGSTLFYAKLKESVVPYGGIIQDERSF